jgi:hypothetical protein
MSRLNVPAAPTVAAALSGFVVGVILTLVLTGTLAAGSHSAQPVATLPPATAVPDLQMYRKVYRLVGRVLGPGGYPPQPRSRLDSVKLLPAVPDLGPPTYIGEEKLHRFRSVLITFRLNNHPLGPAWRLKAAEADVFGVMKTLYTSQLPVYDVQMVGDFPLKQGKSVKSQPAVIAYLDHFTAARIPWKRWGREDEGRLWTMLARHYVDPRFA